MLYDYNKKFVRISQMLRRNMTKEEKHLWYDFLKKLPMNVNRQKVIGNYIVDFFIAQNRLVIELDGIQHGNYENIQKDKQRDDFLKSLGITILRYTNKDINKNFNAVCVDILSHLNLSEDDMNFN